MLLQESTTGRDSKSSWPKHEGILSQTRCFLQGWWGQGRVTALQWVPVCPTESGAPSEHMENVLGRPVPVLMPQAAGTCLDGLISNALAQGWLLSIVPAWNRPSLSLHSYFGGLCSLSSVVHGSILLTHFTVPCASV